MDIIHNNIHMDMVKCRAVSQMTLEDDMNLPQDNPDLDKIIFREGTLNLTDTVVTNDHVLVKGQIVMTGGYELVEKIDSEGYEWVKELGIEIEQDEERKPIILESCGKKEQINNG